MPRTTSLSLDLLETYAALIENGGDAARTAEQLGINQPSMSKRLKYFQQSGNLLERPWLTLEGRTWQPTAEGERVLPAVREIVGRYRLLTRFVEGGETTLTFACGQLDLIGPVRRAVTRVLEQLPGTRIRISTIRGRERIERVSSGALELATVSQTVEQIEAASRRTLHIEALAEDPLALVSSEGGPWSKRVARLNKTRVSAEELTRFPLILPEPDSGARQQLDAVLRSLDLFDTLQIALELGGWRAICDFARAGVGVGLVPSAAVDPAAKLIVRRLDPRAFPPIVTRAICRKVGGSQELDLSPAAAKLLEALRATCSDKNE